MNIKLKALFLFFRSFHNLFLCYQFYSSTFHYYREILIRESVKTIEFLSLTLKIKEQYKKSGYSDYENYLRNYPYRCVNQIIKNIRNNELGGN